MVVKEHSQVRDGHGVSGTKALEVETAETLQLRRSLVGTFEETHSGTRALEVETTEALEIRASLRRGKKADKHYGDSGL